MRLAASIATVCVIAACGSQIAATNRAYCDARDVPATGAHQPKTLEECLSIDPSDIPAREDEPQEYVLTTLWRNRDLYGKLTNEFTLTGRYTRALEGGLVRWNYVYIMPPDAGAAPENSAAAGPESSAAAAKDSAGAIPGGVYYECMEDWTYKSPEDIAGAGFFDRLPSDDSQHALRTLIWDAVAFEVFASTYFDKLRLNESATADEYEDFTAQMADWGSLIMKDLRLTWTGITALNDETCAVIDYRSWVNPIESASIVMSVKGRSLYWGAIWISLEDKQIERATMNEDVIVETSFGPDKPVKRQNMQREVRLEKIAR